MQIISNNRFQSKQEFFNFANFVLKTISQESLNFSKLIKLQVELENGLKKTNFNLNLSEEASLLILRHNLNLQIEKGSIQKISNSIWKITSSKSQE